MGINLGARGRRPCESFEDNAQDVRERVKIKAFACLSLLLTLDARVSLHPLLLNE